MVNAVLRKRSDVGNPIVRSKQICRFPFRMCMVFLFVTVCVSQAIAAGFNSGSSSGRLSASNLRRKNVQRETGREGGKIRRTPSAVKNVQEKAKSDEELKVHDVPSDDSQRGHETVDGVEYFYFRTYSSKEKYHEGKYDVVVLENDRQCAVNIMDDRTTLVLPEWLGGLSLVALGTESCANLADVEEVKLPPRLRQIGYRAFEGCSSLKSIVLPRCLKFIEGEAFKDCEKLPTIDLHEGMGVDVFAFRDWTGLEKIVLPDGMATMPCFSGCTSLTDVKIPKSVKKMWCCSGCINLQEIVLPSGIEEIPSAAFDNCEKLSRVTLPDTIKRIKFHAFRGCSSLKKIDLPYKISRIETAVFAKCSSLESITIPENVEEIEDVAFSECTSLKEVVLPSSVKHIHPDAFVDCNNIKTFKVPASIKDQVLNAKTGHLYDSKRFKDVPEVNIVIVND